MADKLIKFKNDKNLSRKECRQTFGSLIKIATDAIAFLTHTNSQLTHRCRFAQVSNLDKTYQQLTKTVRPGSEEIFGGDLLKMIQGKKTSKFVVKIFIRQNFS